MMLVPAGAPVDAVIKALEPLLQKGDILIDAGNSYFKDTDIRAKRLAEKGIQFLGVGVSGGEEGARHGPSIMPGGPKEAYERVRPILEAAAAKVGNAPCVAYLGPGSSGHFVKMVHNGIEYGIMQLIGETYDLMKKGLGLNDQALHDVYDDWNKGELQSYLIEITANIFGKLDDRTGKAIVDDIRDVAKQKGTGMWTSQSGMELQVPIPTIDMAVAMRDLSMLEDQRKRGAQVLARPNRPFNGDRKASIEALKQGLDVALIVTYAQGMALLATASGKLSYGLNMETLARIWRGGCIIRSVLLDDICKAFHREPGLPNLLFDPDLSKRVMREEQALRKVVALAADLEVAAPAFMSVISYIDALRSGWLPANLIQAQRDYFGAHTYERTDEKGTYHTEWVTTKAGT